MVRTTGETTTTRVFAVLSYPTVTGGDVAAVFARLREPCRHFSIKRISLGPPSPSKLIAVHPTRNPSLSSRNDRQTNRLPRRIPTNSIPRQNSGMGTDLEARVGWWPCYVDDQITPLPHWEPDHK
jgi:hypothetical protein